MRGPHQPKQRSEGLARGSRGVPRKDWAPHCAEQSGCYKIPPKSRPPNPSCLCVSRVGRQRRSRVWAPAQGSPPGAAVWPHQ